MKPCPKTRSGKSGCANIFLELPLTIWFQHYHHECNIMLMIIHWLLYNDYLYTYLHLQFWHSRRSRIHKQPPEVLLKFLQISQEILKNTYFEEHLNDCFCALITSSYTDFHNPLQDKFYIFTNNFFFVTQLKQ